jgi:SulP family sulfate permease
MTMLSGHDAATLRAVLVAPLTVAMLAVPLSLAIAIASGAAPEVGS